MSGVILTIVGGSRQGFGLHLAAFVSRGIHWRTGHSDALGGEPESVTDSGAEPNGTADGREEVELDLDAELAES